MKEPDSIGPLHRGIHDTLSQSSGVDNPQDQYGYLQQQWMNEHCPMINGIIFPSGYVQEIHAAYLKDSYDFHLEKGGNVSLSDGDDLDWVVITTLAECCLPGTHQKVVCGETGWGGDGFLALVDSELAVFKWLAFFDFSNPFVQVDVNEGVVLARTNLDHLWSFPIEQPENVSVLHHNSGEKYAGN